MRIDTSKSQSEKDEYGQKGLFLASLASLSLLTITSHHIRHQSTNTVVLHHSATVARLIPAPVQQRLKLGRHGTSVTVNDLFGNMPVRVKNRALILQKPDELEREWDYLKQTLVPLMLANDQLNKLVLSDTGRSRKLTIRSSAQSLLTSGPSQKAELEVRRINSILVQASLINFHTADCWNTVSARVPNISIRAAISLVPGPTKKVQFISLGMAPLFPINNTNVLYNEVNRLFALSDFGTLGDISCRQAEIQTRESSAQGEQDNRAVKAPTKAIDKWPMFYIRIDTDFRQKLYDDGIEFVSESNKSIQRIMDVLAAMVNEFLKQNNLRPRAEKRQRKVSQSLEDPHVVPKEAMKPKYTARLERPDIPSSCTDETLDGRLKLPSFQKAARTGKCQNFGSWSRIKAARGTSMHTKTTRLAAKHRASDPGRVKTTCQASGDNCPSTQDIAATLSNPSGDTVSIDSSGQLGSDHVEESRHQAEEALDDSTDAMIRWVDPYTGKAHIINARTGQSMSSRHRTPSALAYNRPRSTGSIQLVRPESRRRPESATPGKQNIWIESLLKKWDNPAFSRTEKPITSIDASMGHDNTCNVNSCDGLGGIRSLEVAGCTKFRGKLWKRHLQLAEVIAQVDQKFIFTKMKAAPDNNTGNHDSGNIFALIDQHAADERCRVEQLFEELFINSGDGLDQSIDVRGFELNPITFEIKPAEVPLFRRYLEYFSSWGIHYGINHERGSRVGLGAINSLPTLIAERCRNEPNLAIDLIRNEIWKREESGKGPSQSKTPGDKRGPQKLGGESAFMDLDRPDSGVRHGWVERLSGCPQGIIDMLNSRACRSAIMFNDVLTVDECQSLVSRLARCVFPFQCAHGRPSMVPILDMQSTGKEGDISLLDSVSDSVDFEPAGKDSMHLGFVEAFKGWRDTLG